MPSTSRWCWGLAIVVLAGGSLRAEIPDAAKQDPRFALGYVVVTHYPGVRPDGTGDSTSGLQAAISDAYDNHLTVLFPAGTYLISDTLKCYEWNFWDARRQRAKNPDRRNHVLVGSTLGDTRPLLKLTANAAGFGDPDKPRPMLAYRVFTAENPQATEPIEPDDPLLVDPPNFQDQPNILFHSELRGVDFDCGGNRGAIGVAFRAAQESSIVNVKVDATGASAGIRGIPGRNGGAANLEVVGGDYGLDLVDGGLAGTIAVGVRLIDQAEEAVRQRDFCPLTMVGFQIVKERGPAIRVRQQYKNTASGTLCAVDGSIEVTGGPAIDNADGLTVYLRNVFVKGANALVQSADLPGVTGAGQWSRLAEYAYTDQRTPEDRPPYQAHYKVFRVFSLLDGEVSRAAEPVTRVEAAGAPPVDLVSRHLWAALPAYEGQDDGTCVITRPPYNAAPGDDQDDRAAIQAAIDDASMAGHGRVFIPAGTFQVGGPLTLRANTHLLGAGRLVSIIATHPDWQPAVGSPAVIETVDDREATTTVAFLTINTAAAGPLDDRGAHAFDRFTHLHWRAGRKSAVIGVSLAKEWIPQVISNPHDNVLISGSGGGQFYFLAPSWRWFGGHPDGRAVHIVGTTEPLSIYGLNLEFVARSPAGTPATNVELTDASNVRIYCIKREMVTPTAILTNCHNVGIFGHGREVSVPYAGSGGLLQVLGNSDGITIAPVLFDATDYAQNGEATIRSAIEGEAPVAVTYPECVSVYKRGELDDAAMGR